MRARQRVHRPLLVVLELLVEGREGGRRRNVRVDVGFLFDAIDAAGELYPLSEARGRVRRGSCIDERRNFRAGAEHSGRQGRQGIRAGRCGGWRARRYKA